MIIFYQYFVFFFMNRNYTWLFPYFWRFNFLTRSFEIDFKSKIREWLQIFIILINTLLQPEALIGSNVFIIASILVSVTWKKLFLLPGLYENEDIQLTLHVGGHIEATQLLKMFVFFSQKFASNQLNVLVRLKRYLGHEEKLFVLANSFIYSNCNYSFLVWILSSKRSINKTEHLQKQTFYVLDEYTSSDKLLLKNQLNHLWS